GCGSSREHAPQALAGWGIRAVVAESFAEIFAGNGAALGLVCASAQRESIDRLQASVERTPSLSIEVDVEGRRVLFGGGGFSASIPEGAREGFLTGEWDAVGTLLAAEDAIGRVEERLPYLRGW
ncbi:MAG: isopropylmalate isomerase, partial [Planctomycetes bacterium]|nr:isopropylmalate isomerase [Planctomycetota bacterium]